MAEPIKYKTIIFIVLTITSLFPIYSVDISSLPEYLLKLDSIYGDEFTIIDSNTIKWIDGDIQILDDGLKKDNKELIENGDIEDQFLMVYPKGDQTTPPLSPSNDPGRIRNSNLFKKLYGSTPEEVQQHLKPLNWMPKYSDKVIPFSIKYGAWDSLKKVSDALERLSLDHIKFVVNTAGTYNWRVIKDTDRLSAHSFGIAIDISVEYSSYWKWDKVYEYRNNIPYEIVKIFEDNGFIWGGKWYHYDTMHFEYRPELL